MGFFAACLAVLDQCAQGTPPGVPGARGAEDLQLGFLEEIGYIRRDPPVERYTVTAADRVTADHRRALLALASRFERSFRLPMRQAPGAVFFGAQLAPAAFGLGSHGVAAIGVAGRGATLQRAFESCVGEAAEALSIREPDQGGLPEIDHPPPQTQRGAGVTCRQHRDQLDWALAGIGLGSGTPLDSVGWVEATALGTGRKSLFPLELCWRRIPDRRRAPRPAETTGLAAGPTPGQATLKALLEVVERDAVALWWHGGADARLIPPAMVRDLGVAAVVETLRAGSTRPHWFIDLTTDLGIPVIGALSAEPDGKAVIAGFDAGLDLAGAMIGAALEMSQMELAQALAFLKRAQDGEDALTAIDRLWIERHDHLHVDAFPRLKPGEPTALQSVDPTAEPLAACVARLQRRGLDAYRLDQTQEQIGVPVFRVLVPGLQSVKIDWRTPRLVEVAEANGRSLDHLRTSPSPI